MDVTDAMVVTTSEPRVLCQEPRVPSVITEATISFDYLLIRLLLSPWLSLYFKINTRSQQNLFNSIGVYFSLKECFDPHFDCLMIATNVVREEVFGRVREDGQEEYSERHFNDQHKQFIHVVWNNNDLRNCHGLLTVSISMLQHAHERLIQHIQRLGIIE